MKAYKAIFIACLAILCCFADKKKQIQFLPLKSKGDLMWAAGWGADKYGVWLYAEIYALDKDIVFLLGNLRGENW